MLSLCHYSPLALIFLYTVYSVVHLLYQLLQRSLRGAHIALLQRLWSSYLKTRQNHRGNYIDEAIHIRINVCRVAEIRRLNKRIRCVSIEIKAYNNS